MYLVTKAEKRLMQLVDEAKDVATLTEVIDDEYPHVGLERLSYLMNQLAGNLEEFMDDYEVHG